MNNNLKVVLNKQKESLSLLEGEIKALENLDLTKKNATLEKENSKLTDDISTLRKKVDVLNKDNSTLRETLQSKLYNEKFTLINDSHKQIDTYFGYGHFREQNKLIELESRCKFLIDTELDEIKHKLSILDKDATAKIATRTREFSQELLAEFDEELQKAKDALSQKSEVKDKISAEYDKLADEGITEQDFDRAALQSNFERFLGLNIINKIGIGLLILGVIFAAQYTYARIDNGLKSMLMFALGAAFIGAGEFMSRKKANVFSLGITSGGVAISYIALAMSHFVLNVLTLYPAALLCIGITIGTFLLSIRHKSQVIATFALIGGFAPLILLNALDRNVLYTAMAYFLLHGAFALVLSLKNKWIVTAFFGLSLNAVATIMISGLFNSSTSHSGKAAFITYVALSFITYTLIPIIGTYFTKDTFKKSDIVLIALNTFLSSIILYNNFARLEIIDLNGFIPFGFMLTYIGLTLLLKWKMPAENDMRMLFFITATTFSVLIVPMHFDTMWFSLGWLVQGMGLIIYGVVADKQKFTAPGFIIYALCLLSFLSFDISDGEHFLLKYSLITLSGVILTALFTYRAIDNGGVRTLKYAATVNLWLWLMYIIGDAISEVVAVGDNRPWFSLAVIPVTLALGFALQRIKPIADEGIKRISYGLYTIGIGWIFILNFSSTNYFTGQSYVVHSGDWFLAAFLFASVNITALLALADILHQRVQEGTLRSEWRPFLLSLFFTVLLTQNLLVFYDVPWAGMSISIVYAVLAVLWCVFGFWKRFAFMRKFGLAMSLLAVSKLFLIDMWSLSEGNRIITYFALGGALIGISYIYQQFSKKLEEKESE